MIRRIFIGLISLFFIVMLAVAGLILTLDTDQYRAALQRAVRQATGLELQIAGDIGVNVFPNISLTLADVRLRDPDLPQELASTASIELRVDGAALIGGEILIQEFLADDFHLNYAVDPDGASNWDRLLGQTDTPPADSAPAGGTPVNASFQRIVIDNASVDVNDLASGSRFSLTGVNLEGTDVNANGRPFAISLSLNYISYDPASGLPIETPINLLTEVAADLEADSLTLDQLQLSVTPMLLTGQIDIAQMTTAPQVSGSLQAAPFDLLGLLENLQNSDTPASGQRPRLGLSLAFNADSQTVTLGEFSGTLDESSFDGEVNIRLATAMAPMNVSYRLNSGPLDLTPFMADEESTPDPADSAAAPAEEAHFPIETLGTLDLLGSISIESITVNDMLFSDINVLTNIEDSVLDVELQPVTAFSGRFGGNLRVDGRSADAPFTAELLAGNLNIVDLASSFSRIESIQGRLNVGGSFSGSAASADTLLNTLSGNAQFNITENSVDIGVIKQVFTAISALSPNGVNVDQWPDTVSFSELGGYMNLNGGLDSDQQVGLKMDNFTLGGTGGLDMAAGSFGYDFQFALLGPPEIQTFPIDARWHGIQWPVNCAANFSDAVSQYCRPDFARVREIFTQIGTNALRNELQNQLDERVPEQLRDAAKGLLNNLLPR